MSVPPWLRRPEDVNALVGILWPANVARGSDGVLEVAGVRVDEIAAMHGTPAYVLDEADLRDRARAFRDAFAPATIYYAGKAFLSKAVVRIIA